MDIKKLLLERYDEQEKAASEMFIFGRQCDDNEQTYLAKLEELSKSNSIVKHVLAMHHTHAFNSREEMALYLSIELARDNERLLSLAIKLKEFKELSRS